MRYLEDKPFAEHGVSVVPFRLPLIGVWEDARDISAVAPLMMHGVSAVADQARDVAARHRATITFT